MKDPKQHQQHFDKDAIITNFDKAAASYEAAAAVQSISGERLLQRLQLLLLQPQSIVDLGCASGKHTRLLGKQYPKAKITGIDISPEMIKLANKSKPWFSKQRYQVADIESLPFADNSVDLLFSNMVLHWMPNPQQAWTECQRVLKVGGALMFTMPGPDTLKEFRQSFATVDEHHHVYPFIDMHDVGDQLLMAGFADPVMDRQDFVMRYKDFSTLLQDLRMTGVTNKNPQRNKGLTGKAKFKKMREHYESLKTEDGKYPATYEIIYGHAFKAEAKSRKQQAADGEVKIAIDKIGRVER